MTSSWTWIADALTTSGAHRWPESAIASGPRHEDTHDEFRLLVFLAKVVVGVVIVIVVAALLLAFRPPPPCRADTPANAPCTPTATPP